MGRTGDSPVPVGDSPTGMAAAFVRKPAPLLVKNATAIPPGESPRGTGQWPVLPRVEIGFPDILFAPWKRLMLAGCLMLVRYGDSSLADSLTFETVQLPGLRVNEQAARAHTQGLEVAAGKFYVTARRDDIMPKRALLLRTDPARTDWDFWDITPLDARGTVLPLDHPGGMQSDGKRLWIPLAESKRNGRSIIRAFPLAGLVAGRTLKSEFEFPMNDHIGAVAVSAERKLIFGANWDTEAVYVWDFEGRLERTLSATELTSRGLGVISGSAGRAGLAVQDWKVVGDRFFASGLFRGSGSVAVAPQSRLMSFAAFLEPGFQRWSVTLPTRDGTELAQEAMAVSEGLVHFLPEDLGASNRIFRAPLADLMKRSASQEWRSSNAP